MIPKVVCAYCRTEVSPSDQFCSSCGTKIEWADAGGATPGQVAQVHPGSFISASRVCILCGQQNPPDVRSCESCGAVLSGFTPQAPAVSPQKSALPLPSLKAFQSWKLTAALGIVFIATVLIMKITHKEDQRVGTLSPRAQMMVEQIDSLQKVVDANPNDSPTLLQLANLLHDVKMFDRAITIYKQYLERIPSDPNARVDLGISYFQESFTDSIHGSLLLTQAEQEMKKALTYDPKHQLAMFNLGIITFHSGDPSKATEWFKRCVAIDSTSEVSRRAQQFLNQHSLTIPSTS